MGTTKYRKHALPHDNVNECLSPLFQNKISY